MRAFGVADISIYGIIFADFVGAPNLGTLLSFWFGKTGLVLETFKHSALCICEDRR